MGVKHRFYCTMYVQKPPLNVHADAGASIWARVLKFGLSLYLNPYMYFVYVSSEDFDEHRLV